MNRRLTIIGSALALLAAGCGARTEQVVGGAGGVLGLNTGMEGSAGGSTLAGQPSSGGSSSFAGSSGDHPVGGEDGAAKGELGGASGDFCATLAEPTLPRC
jgi:hypothetical protein